MSIILKTYDAVIGIDPGLKGAITIISNKSKIPQVFDAPVLKIPNPNKKSKIKTKSDMDPAGIVSILSYLRGKKVIVGLEKVHAMPKQGNVSMFNFGMGYGMYQGILEALGFEIVKISPQAWKKFYPRLDTDEIIDIKKQIQDLRKTLKTTKDKTIKKQIDKYNKNIKTLAKDAARSVASKLYTELVDQFKLKKHDGRAESLLICNYIKESYDK